MFNTINRDVYRIAIDTGTSLTNLSIAIHTQLHIDRIKGATNGNREYNGK